MPAGSNASRRAGHQLRGDAIAAGRGESMKRGKRGAERSAEEGVKNKKRFVGVRQRPSGRWVAEIKDTTQKIRLWLGTFDSAEEGAKAYDNAARALRGANTRTNFVAAIASSCESTVPTKAARLIRQRQAAAAATSSKLCALRHKPDQAISRPPLRHGSDDWDAHSQEGTSAQSAITSDSLSNAATPWLPCDAAAPPAASSSPVTDRALLSNQAANPESFPCATNRADDEAASSVEDSDAVDAIRDSHGRAVSQQDPFCKEDVEPVAISDVNDPLDHRNSAILDMIPWPDYVLMEGLDLSCETSSTGMYPSFEYSTEAMDRDSEQYLSDDSSDFLLRLQQQTPTSQQHNEFQAHCELPRPPVLSPDGGGECPGHADQALWGAMDGLPLCMVA